MSKRGSPAVQVFIVIAVVGAFLYGFYCYHDQYTRLKRSEESVDKLKQKTEYLSAQLQVLYEHKTRLETAVSQEKEIAKKAKDDFDAQKKEQDGKVDQQRNENAELSQQVESLQKKLEAGEEAANKASQEYKRAQQENDNTVTKLRDDLANMKRRLEDCDRNKKQQQQQQQEADDDDKQKPDRDQDNQVAPAAGESNALLTGSEGKIQQQEVMQVVAPNVANNQSLAARDDFESRRDRIAPVDSNVDSPQQQQESNKSIRTGRGAKDESYEDDVERPHKVLHQESRVEQEVM